MSLRAAVLQMLTVWPPELTPPATDEGYAEAVAELTPLGWRNHTEALEALRAALATENAEDALIRAWQIDQALDTYSRHRCDHNRTTWHEDGTTVTLCQCPLCQAARLVRPW